LIQPLAKPADFLAPNRETLFADRAVRFAKLAEDHAYGDYLRFLGRLTTLQHECLQQHPAVPLADEAALLRDREHRLPPFSAAGWRRDPVWRSHLQHIIAGLRDDATAQATAGLDLLARTSPMELETLADRVLANDYAVETAGTLPFIAAALQVYWTWLAAAPKLTEKLIRLETPELCPCCGSLPVASVVRVSGEISNLRYLHCSLCNSEWNRMRAQCVLCAGSQHLDYRRIEGAGKAVQAECCADCQIYLKIMRQDEDAQVDPVADDLATLVLDMLLDESGLQRLGPNPLFVPGRAESEHCD